MTGILSATLVLGAIGLIFGVLLVVAGKKFEVQVDERVAQVRSCVAGANCGACGFPGCDQFAQAVVDGKAPINGCAPSGNAGAQAIAEIMGLKAETIERKVARVLCQGTDGIAKTRYIYDGYKSCAVAVGIAGGPKECRFSCVGLGDCMDKCAFGAIRMQDGLCVIDEKKCTGCGACVMNCPRNVLTLKPLSEKVIVRCRNEDVARTARAVCMNACIGCGRCVKECAYNAIVVENGFAHINPEKCTRCGKCAEVCPCNCITMQ